MPFNSRVFRIFIASPSDVSEEREVIARVIREWNDLHSFERKVVLLPLRWETHSAPQLGKRPQELINTEIVDQADMAVGVFWTRIGTPTGGFDSGTIEEIERLGKANKLVMLYFSKAKVELDEVDLDQYKRLKDFKKQTYPNGLVENYSNIVDFRDMFAKQLEIKIRTLIAQDSKNDDSELEQINTPRLNFEFIDPLTKENTGDILLAKPRILKFNITDIKKLPDYEIDKKKEKLFIRHNKSFYRDYVEYIKEDWGLIPLNFNLSNPSSISIRDIFIDIRCKKTKDFLITREKSKKPKAEDNGLMINFSESFDGLIGKSTANVSETDDEYILQISYEALQPQRNVSITHPLFISGTKKQTIELKVRVYADCFPNPIDQILKVNLTPVNIKRTPIQILDELDILEIK